MIPNSLHPFLLIPLYDTDISALSLIRLHMLPPFGQDVASVAPFYGRLASLPLRQAVTTNRKDLKLSFTEGRNPFRFRGERNSGLAISSSDVLSGPGGHQG